MTTIQMAGNGFGGLIQGAFGNYEMASDGTFTVDARDVPALLTRGLTYVSASVRTYAWPGSPLAAATGQLVASHALSNGTVSVTNQPDVPRPAKVVIGTGTSVPTAGTVAFTYQGVDGASHTDTFAATTPAASGSVTNYLSSGINSITSVTVAGIVGGTSPWFRLDTTADLAVPMNVGGADMVPIQEFEDNVAVAAANIGTAIAGVLGGYTPHTAPNATHTFSLTYSFISPES